MPRVTIRDIGDDLPEGKVAIHIEGLDAPQYATLENAQRYVASVGNDQQARDFFAKRPIVQLNNEDANRLAAERYAASIQADSVQEARQRMRRTKAFEDLFTVILDRAPAGGGHKFMYVTWEQFETMFKEYQDAHEHGEAKRCEFQPLSAYAHKIVRIDENGNVTKMIRPIFQNEVGVLEIRGEGKIVILRDRGPGDLGDRYVQRPECGGSVE